MVREDTVIRMIQSLSEKYTGRFFIFDEQGRQLLASEKTDDAATEGVRRLMPELKEGSEGGGIYRVNGKSYIVSHTLSGTNGWHYVSMLLRLPRRCTAFGRFSATRCF